MLAIKKTEHNGAFGKKTVVVYLGIEVVGMVTPIVVKLFAMFLSLIQGMFQQRWLEWCLKLENVSMLFQPIKEGNVDEYYKC